MGKQRALREKAQTCSETGRGLDARLHGDDGWSQSPHWR
jgi:hypothetical protein